MIRGAEQRTEVEPSRRRRDLWNRVFLVIWLAYGAFLLWRGWDEARERDPGAQLGEFLWTGLISWGPAMAGAVALLLLIGLIMSFEGWLLRPSRPPEGSIPPFLVLRRFPLHVGVCAVLLTLTAWGVINNPTVGMLGIAGAGWAFVTLARRLGLEPPDDPAAPHNRKGL